MSLLNPGSVTMSEGQELNFTFHNVSIKSESAKTAQASETALHSTMSLLNQGGVGKTTTADASLHSTMSLLNRLYAINHAAGGRTLHSTMSLLNLHRVTQTCRTLTTLHSTMSLLNPD